MLRSFLMINGRKGFNWLIATKRAQYRATCKHDVLAPDWVSAFLDRLRHEDFVDLGVYLSTLRANGQPIAAELNIKGRGLLHGWLVAYDPDFSSYSPGHQVILNILEHMPQYGLNIYDAGPGSYDYKKYWVNACNPIGVGELRGSQTSSASTQVLDFLEKALPARGGEAMGRLRRRSEMILSTETGFDGRVKGFANALRAIKS